MSNYRERNYELIQSISFYQEDALRLLKRVAPGVKHVPESDLLIDNRFSLDFNPESRSGAMSETENTSVAGISYNVTVEFTITEPDVGHNLAISLLKRMNHNMIVTTFGGDRFVIVTNPETYHLSKEFGGKSLSVKLTCTTSEGILQIQP